MEEGVCQQIWSREVAGEMDLKALLRERPTVRHCCLPRNRSSQWRQWEFSEWEVSARLPWPGRFTIVCITTSIARSGGSRVLVSGEVGSGQEELELLGKTIGSCLQGKKFLLVLDDVRNTNGWNNVKTILPVLQELS
uniref:Putative disease resistance protein RPM1-like isoform X1 n=1 Tax=Davidia involucrata TaxID=16924 RepID=A0A5B6ZP84_DAVIN